MFRESLVKCTEDKPYHRQVHKREGLSVYR